jgi:alpha-methylacyl-CoA racemase
MERLGLGPAECAARNPKLVYGRMTGWGQEGPLAKAAGHDLNYVALTGALSLTERPDAAPTIPPTVLGDAGGALGLAFGIVSGALSARATGKGCVVDAAILDMVAALSGIALWARATRMLDGGRPSIFYDSPFYDAYRCADGRYLTIGALEPQFYAALLEKLGLADLDPKAQYDTRHWSALKGRLRDLFMSRPSDEWQALLEGTDVCFAPVLSFAEAAAHPHNVARGLYRADAAGRLDAAEAPRFQPLA